MPAQLAVGITPLRRIYDLRHTFATLALHADIPRFEVSRYMGASLGMIATEMGANTRSGCSTASPTRCPTSTMWTPRGR